jgi:L-asparagine transporter-like permease|tara:strand:+ start:713 stop:874 length:162 start_codon:yes stop_codon:yes gene_type:complete
MIKYLETYLGKWIGWRAFWEYFFFGAAMTITAALAVGIFYSFCVIILLLEPTL